MSSHKLSQKLIENKRISGKLVSICFCTAQVISEAGKIQIIIKVQ